MAQVKKLESGGASPSNTQTTPIKRMYNGVELTDADLDKIVNDTAEFISKNSNYSEDIRGISELSNKVKEEFKKGNMPEFDPTGTGVKIGNINISAGKHNQNIFGNFSGDKLGREFAFRLKEGFDSYTRPSENTQTTVSTTPTQKYHVGLARTISDRYFGGNWENAQKGIGELTSEKRLAYVKQGLKDSILKYKEEYGEDSKYSNRLAEIDAATPERIKEIAYEMGFDATDFLEGTAEQREAAKQKAASEDPYYALRQQGEIIDDDFLNYKGVIGLKDKTGKVRLFNRNDLTEIQGQHGLGEIEENFGAHYGTGLFYDRTGGWKWGNKTELAQGDLYNPVTTSYLEIVKKNSVDPLKIDFKNQRDLILQGIRDFNTNTLEYYDLSDQFENIGDNRIIAKDVIKDNLGNIDLQRSKIYMYDKAKNQLIPIAIDVDPFGPSKARSLATKTYPDLEYDLGLFGRGVGRTQFQGSTINTNFGTPSNLDPNIFNRSVGNVVGWRGKQITPDNARAFMDDALKQKFEGDLSPEHAKNMYHTLLTIFNNPKYNLKQTMPESNIKVLERLLAELYNGVGMSKKDQYTTSNVSTNNSRNSNPIQKSQERKKGGILKRQAGGGLRSTEEQLKTQTSKPLPKKAAPVMGYGSARIRDVGTYTTADKADVAGIALSGLSLVGGAVGVGAGLANMIVQSVADSSRHGFWSKENATNLGINLGFTLLSAIPGGGLLKAGKTIGSVAKKTKVAAKALDEAKDLLKVAEGASKVGKIADEYKDVIKAADKVVKMAEKDPRKLEKFINISGKVARTGMIGTGAFMGVNAGINIGGNIAEHGLVDGLGHTKISDLQGIVGGIASAKGIKRNFQEKNLRKVTDLTTSTKGREITVKFKNAPEEIKEIKVTLKNNNKEGLKEAKDEALSKVKSQLNSQIKELELKRKPNVTDASLDEQINKLKASIDKIEVDDNLLKQTANKLGNIKANSKEKVKKYFNELSGSDWDNRVVSDKFKGYKFNSKGKIIDGDDLTWREKSGLEFANKTGYFKDEYNPAFKEALIKMTTPYKSPIGPNPKLLELPPHVPKINSSVSKINKVLNRELNNSLPSSKPLLALPPHIKPKIKSVRKSNKTGINGNTLNSLKRKGLIDNQGQISMQFKEGGELISKFEKSGQLNWTLQNNNEKNYFKQPTYLDRLYQTQNSKLKNRLEAIWNPNSPVYKSGESTETISGEQIKTPIYNTKLKGSPTPEKTFIRKDTPEITTTDSNRSNKKTEYTPYKKRTLNIDPTRIMELVKLADTIGTNRKISQKLRSVSPVMLQMPSEIYKPVVTNLANENFVNNQVNSYLHQASKPMTSDSSLQKGTQLEALSKTIPMIIQARAANTDMYNQTLGVSRDNAEKYAGIRNEIANANRERIGAHEARLAQIGATELALNKESRNAFADEEIKNYKEKAIRDYTVKNQLELNRLNTERTNKLKPYFEKYNNLLNDPKTSDVYKRAKAWHDGFPDKNLEDYTENGKTYSELLALEQSNAQKVYEAESEKLRPYYETAILNLRGGNPYSRTYSFGTYKKGGSIDPKVEIQNLKNKMKAKEINAKSDDKAKDRNERAVANILKSMSKESLFLLKTMLGK